MGLSSIIGGEQQEELGLERVGILELVYEEMCKALLQFGTNAAVVSNEVDVLRARINPR